MRKFKCLGCNSKSCEEGIKTETLKKIDNLVNRDLKEYYGE